MSSQITINGVKITIEGNGNVCIRNGKVIVDGKEINVGDKKDVTIIGNVGKIECDGDVVVEGAVNGNISCGGSCRCGDISGNLNAGGSVHGGNCGGALNAGGSIHVTRG